MKASPWRLPLLTAGLSGLVYLVTMAPDLTWSHYGADGGELITAAVTLGVPHPPGYPTYVLLGHLFHYLPWGTVAWRLHLLSALASAGAAGLVTATANQWPGGDNRPVAALAAGLTLAWQPLIWSQALIAEVYGLNLLLLALLLWLLLTKAWPRRAGLVLGLSLTTHLTSGLMLPLALALTPRRAWPRLLVGLGLGLTPFLAVLALARSDSVIQWGAITTLSDWLWLISGALFRPNVFGLPLSEFTTRLRQWIPLLLTQLAVVGWLLLPWGAATLRQQRRPAQLLAATAGAYFIYAFGYSSIDAIIFTMPAFLLLSILLTPALRRLDWAALLLPSLLLALNFSVVNLHQEIGPQPAATQLLNNSPDKAILVTPGDQTIFTLWYVQQVNEQRPDVLLVDANLFAFDWYRQHLQNRDPTLVSLAADNVNAFIGANRQQRPVCLVFLAPAPARDCQGAWSPGPA